MAIKFLNSVAVDTDVLFVDTANERVGIGTTSPTHKLQVVGNGVFNSILNVQDPAASTNGNLALLHDSGGSSLYSNPASGNHSTAVLKLGINSSEKMRIANNGNVGIGTTSPNAKLQVNDNVRIGNTSTGVRFYIQGVDEFRADALDVAGNGWNSLHLRADGTDGLFLQKDTNNVGIGTTSPSTELDVVGTARMDTGITEGIHYVGTGLEHWGDGGTGMSFPANDILSLRTASSDRLYINSAGNVGIGTTTPGEKLEVAGNILANATNVAINIGSTISLTPGGGHPNTGAGTLIVGGKTNGGYNYQPGVITLINQNPNIGAGADTGVIQFAGKDDATSGYVSANIKAFTTAAAGTGNSGGGIITLGTSPGYGAPIERFRITTSGNVGIGLTSPSSKLHVSSTTSTSLTTVGVQTESGTIGNLVGIGFATSGAAGKYKSAIGHITTSSNQGVGAMVFCVDGVSDVNPVEIGDEKMRISSAGNVGIGTTSPGAKLDVTGTGKFTGQVTIPATPVAATDAASKSYVDAQVGTADTLSEVLALGNTSGANDISMLLGQRIYFNNDGENIRSIVNGDLELNSRTDLRIKANNNGTAGVGLEFWNGGSEKMRITSSGNVGIGTTSPSMKLEVSTDARMVAKFTGNTDDGTGYVGAVVEIESNNDARGRGVYLTHRLTTDTSDSEWYAGVPYTGGGYSIGNAAYGTSVNSNTGPAHKDQSKLFITEAGNVGIGTTSPG